MKKIVIIVLIFLSFFKYVYAEEVVCDSEKNKILITNKNYCSSSASAINSSNCDGSESYLIEPEKPLNVSYTIPKNVPTPNTKPFKVFVLVDDSNSMSTGDKIKHVRGSLKNLAEGVQAINPSSKIVVKYFTSSLTSEKSIGSYLSSQNYKDVKAGDEATEHVEGLEKAITYFESLKKSSDKDKYVPLVVFITDGYPNVSGSGPKGYSSSARHFYKSAKKFYEVRKLINEIDSNAKIITVGIDIGGSTSEDYMPNYLLNPTDANYEKLNSGLDVNGEVNLESKKFYEMMNAGTGSKSFKEVVMTIRAYPDLGLVGASDLTDNKKMVFKRIGVLKNNDKAALKSSYSQGGGLIFGPFKNKKGLSSGDFSVKYDGHTFSKGNNDFDLVGSSTWKYFLIDCSSKKNANKLLSASKIEISVSGHTLEYNTYQRSGSFSHVHYKNSVDKYFPKVLDNIPVNSWREAITSNNNNNKKTCENKTLSGGKQREHKKLCESKNVAIGRYCYGGNARDVVVPIVLDETTKFDGGTLNNYKNEGIISGRGFKVQGISLTNTVTWQFSYLGVRANSPNISNQVQIVKFDGQDVRYNELTKYNGSSCTNSSAFGSVDDLKNVVNSKLFGAGGIISGYSENLKSNLKDGFETIDFNNKDGKRKDFIDIIDYSNDGIGNGRKYTYVMAAKRIMNDGHYKFKYADSHVPDNSLATPGSDRYYYFPFGYNNGDSSVLVKFNSFVPYNIVCKVKVESGGYPTKYVTYRSIDIEDPFPKSGYKSENIPFNWRNWYCDGTGCSNMLSSDNKNRLKNSYNTLFYSINISRLNNYNDNGNYALIDSIAPDGRSSFINSYNYFDVNNAVVNNNFCGYGKWEQNCDRVR